MNFTFTNKTEYFTYKQEWKNRYEAAMKNIRAAALARRDAERSFSAGSKNWPDTARWNHKKAKAEATNLLSERAASKIESANQWLKNRSSV